MALWEVQQYGLDSFADADYVRLYGMVPVEWYQRGIRLLARTTVECVRDALGDLIGQDVERAIQHTPSATQFVVIDPFAESCNSLYWMLRHVRDAQGIAFELDRTIFKMTSRNISFLDKPIELIHGDYRSLLPAYRFPVPHRLIVFVAPPWGDALNELTGLDLCRTRPPITDIIDDFESVYSDTPILYVTQVHQHVELASLANLQRRFDWSELRIYDINSEGRKHGVLLGRTRWQP